MRQAAVTVTFLALWLAPGALPAAETLVIPGSGSMQSLVRDLAAAFNAANRNVVVEVPDSIGTGGGFKAVGEGTATIARVGRRPGEKEAAYGLEFQVFALQPVVFAAHPGVGVKTLTKSQSRDLFAGKIANWKELGGADLPVVVIGREPGETNYQLIRKTFEEWKDLRLAPSAVVAKTDQEMVELIATRAGAVGFNVISEVLDRGLKPLAIGPTVHTDLTYPLLIEAVFVYKPGALAGAAKAFVDFVFSEQGAKLIKAGYAFPKRRGN
jgi:phosphate transport system substrate-binding protein